MKILTYARMMFWTVFRKLLHGKSLHMNGMQGIRANTEMIIKKGGRIDMGRRVLLRQRVSLTAGTGGKLSIGNRVRFNRNCLVICRDKIRIEDDCIFGPNVMLYDHDHMFGSEGLQSGYRTGEIVVGKGCWIGAGVLILRDTHIGEGCVIGAGTVVKGDIPPYSLVTADRSMKIVPLRDR